MEIVGSFLDEDWESLSQILCSGENPDFLLHCDGTGNTLFSGNLQIPPPTFPPSNPTEFCCISQESSNTSEIDEAALFLKPVDVANDHTTFESIINNDGFMLPVYPNDVMEEFLHVKGMENADSFMLKRKSEDEDESEDFLVQNPKKKQRISRNAQKSREAQSKKCKKTIQDKVNEEEGNGGRNRVSCSSYSSEEESNVSQVQNASNSKTRATRGSATDPQSLYARKRRERINERLKILQNLVPNGTKVDISTMLEEAVHYVKFLQLQIKLLSSDNLWMYAPLAYNGMDIGIHQNFSPILRP